MTSVSIWPPVARALGGFLSFLLLATPAYVVMDRPSKPIPEIQMQQEFVIYSKHNCGYCEKLAAFMDQKGIPYIKLTLGEDYTPEEFVNKFGQGSTFPRALLGEELIGGMKETVTYLVENKYV